MGIAFPHKLSIPNFAGKRCSIDPMNPSYHSSKSSELASFEWIPRLISGLVFAPKLKLSKAITLKSFAKILKALNAMSTGVYKPRVMTSVF